MPGSVREKYFTSPFVFLRSPVSAIHARVQHHIGNVFFCVYGEHFLTLGATFSLWRDFFLPARLFFPRATFSQRRDFFSLARLFFAGATLFSLARLFLSGATFFRRRDFFSPARLFFAGATFFAFSLALICRPLLDFIAGSSYEHVQL